jgi:hypothetical protein
MSPRVTSGTPLVIIAGQWFRRTGHQPQPGHEALVVEHGERTPFRCVEL